MFFSLLPVCMFYYTFLNLTLIFLIVLIFLKLIPLIHYLSSSFVLSDSHSLYLFLLKNFLFLGLRTLNLSGNTLSHLEEKNFDGLHSLRHLILDSNKIRWNKKKKIFFFFKFNKFTKDVCGLFNVHTILNLRWKKVSSSRKFGYWT